MRQIKQEMKISNWDEFDGCSELKSNFDISKT